MVGTGSSAQPVLCKDQALRKLLWGTLRQEEVWPLLKEELHRDGAGTKPTRQSQDTRQLGQMDNSHYTQTKLPQRSFKRKVKHWTYQGRLLTERD